MTAAQFFITIGRRWPFVLTAFVLGSASVFLLFRSLPSYFSGVSHVVLVAESGARDPSIGIIDLPAIATSTVVLDRVQNILGLSTTLIELKSHVTASILGRSSIMAINVRDRSAERAIAISNGIADELSRYYGEISTERYDTNVKRLSDELSSEAARKRALDTQISAVAAANPYVVSEKSVDNITTQIAAVSTQRAIALAQLINDQGLMKTTQPSSTLNRTIRHEILASDLEYSKIKATVGLDGAQLVNDRAAYTENFPGLPGEMSKISSESAALKKAEARAMADPNSYSPAAASTSIMHAQQVAVVEGDIERLRQFDNLLATEQRQLAGVPTFGAKYAQLNATRNSLQLEYDALAARRATAVANRAEASSLGTVVVLDRAIKADTQPAGSRARIAAVALLGVIIFSLGVAFVVEAFDPRIYDAEKLANIYGVPVVASIGRHR